MPPDGPIHDQARGESAWPSDTALAIGSVPISAREIGRVAEWIAFLQPGASRAHHEREALTAFLMPRAAVRMAHGASRVEALAHARRRRAELTGEAQLGESGGESGQGPGPIGPPAAPTTVTGSWRDLGLEVWGEMRAKPLETWSEPIEGIGRFTLARRVPYKGREGTLRLELEVIPWRADGPIDVEAALASQSLTIVDPSWRDAVPAYWRAKFKGEQP